MSIKFSFREPFMRYFQLIIAVVALIITSITVFQQLVENKDMTQKVRIDQYRNELELKNRNKLLIKQIDTLRNFLQQSQLQQNLIKKVDSPKGSLAYNQFTMRLSTLENKVDKISKIQDGLRQAINPMKPDEVLTIVRLKDALTEITKDFSALEENYKLRQQAFEESIRHETSSSNQSTNLILVVLIPLVLNFLYTVWKDFKKSDPKEKAE